MIIQQFYSLFAALLPVFYIGSAAKKLIAEQVDNGSFSYVMSAPIKRRTVTVTQGLFLICSVLMMYLLFCLIGIISFAIWGEFMEVRAFSCHLPVQFCRKNNCRSNGPTHGIFPAVRRRYLLRKQ